jgi:phenylpropionate dioxygenase-like ring-hydroxylating dioxygenase large terminal subunit
MVDIRWPMTATAEKAARDQWYCIEALETLDIGETTTRLLGEDVHISRSPSGGIIVTCAGRNLPTRQRYGFLWTTPGEPEADLFPIPEADEPDRRQVPCGSVLVKASGLRIIENFLDMAHFPFVHTDILGAEPHTEVRHYTTEIRRDIDEVWATNCQFFQPQAALSASGGMMAHYMYRVPSPFCTMLYKTCPNAENRWDVICLFVQPMEPDLCRAHPVMFLIDDISTTSELVQFQQMIFLQDRIILENQRPRLMPLDARLEIPTRADASSIAYRRWLKEKGLIYGTTAMVA